MALGIQNGESSIRARTTTRTALAGTSPTMATWPTRALLSCAVVAGPIYVAVGALQLFIRPGFDLTRHDLSLLSNGDLGWIQVSNFIATGLLVVAGALGMRRTLRGGLGGTWGPATLALYGAGLIGAGCFVADPAHGFPPGTPADAHAVSWHGLLHFACGGAGFLGLIAACMVFARRFAALGQRRWALYSRATGVLFGAAFVGIAMGSNAPGPIMTTVILAFTAAVILGWVWISALATRLLAGSPDERGSAGR